MTVPLARCGIDVERCEPNDPLKRSSRRQGSTDRNPVFTGLSTSIKGLRDRLANRQAQEIASPPDG